MSESTSMDRVFHYVLETMVERGNAPHYTEIASKMSVSPEEGKKLLHDLMASGIPAWVYPNTDTISSFPPFSNLPTQYRITIEGQQRWFAQ